MIKDTVVDIDILVMNDGKVSLQIIGEEHVIIVDEEYNSIDVAVDMLPHIWHDRFSSDSKPGEDYYARN